MAAWRVGEARPIAVASLGERYRRYRWSDVTAEEALARSLRRWGQLAPIVVCVRAGQPEVLDGFKRRAAAAMTPGLTTLSAVEVEVDERAAKAAILGLNQATQPLKLWEEAWIVQALVREDGLSQVEAAALLGRHKSWVSRRLALVERLAEPLQEDVRLGLLAAGLARQLVRLPAGNQTALLTAVRREQLNAQEARLLVDLLHGAAPEQERFVLGQPQGMLREPVARPTTR